MMVKHGCRLTKSFYIYFYFHSFCFCFLDYFNTTARTEPKAYYISGRGWGNIHQGRNPLAWKQRDNCWLAFASTGGTGWLSSILGELKLPCCASRHYNWHWGRNTFSKSLCAPCIIHIVPMPKRILLFLCIYIHIHTAAKRLMRLVL